MFIPNLDLIPKALDGDKVATKLFCGAYDLYVSNEGVIYRVNGDPPEGWDRVISWHKPEGKLESVYDNNGFLKPQYWIYPRCINGVFL